ncbi:MAG: hypothetical protein P8M30_16440 [Planctomycetaceae bacterium]|jgi:uncharacterized membrane protein YeaQ/YmgE (transglycosylase-associated protein family)|nr:hypothetical protein [Planctomycetaceae bacterium]
MSILEILVLLVISGVCGSIAQSLVGATRSGCLASIALGFIGALIGIWIARELDLPEYFPVQIGGKAFPVIWSIVGASLFSAILALLSGTGRGKDKTPRP